MVSKMAVLEAKMSIWYKDYYCLKQNEKGTNVRKNAPKTPNCDSMIPTFQPNVLERGNLIPTFQHFCGSAPAMGGFNPMLEHTKA
jgi:hypothetical protein